MLCYGTCTCGIVWWFECFHSFCCSFNQSGINERNIKRFNVSSHSLLLLLLSSMLSWVKCQPSNNLTPHSNELVIKHKSRSQNKTPKCSAPFQCGNITFQQIIDFDFSFECFLVEFFWTELECSCNISDYTIALSPFGLIEPFKSIAPMHFICEIKV